MTAKKKHSRKQRKLQREKVRRREDLVGAAPGADAERESEQGADGDARPSPRDKARRRRQAQQLRPTRPTGLREREPAEPEAEEVVAAEPERKSLAPWRRPRTPAERKKAGRVLAILAGLCAAAALIVWFVSSGPSSCTRPDAKSSEGASTAKATAPAGTPLRPRPMPAAEPPPLPEPPLDPTTDNAVPVAPAPSALPQAGAPNTAAPPAPPAAAPKAPPATPPTTAAPKPPATVAPKPPATAAPKPPATGAPKPPPSPSPYD